LIGANQRKFSDQNWELLNEFFVHQIDLDLGQQPRNEDDFAGDLISDRAIKPDQINLNKIK
jgi:hypothetical protein